MTALVYAFIKAVSDGWGGAATLGSLAAAVILLGAFAVTEMRARQPITPLRLFASMGRSGSLLTRLLLVAGMFGMFFFLTQFVQEVLGFSPLRAAAAFLPMTVALFAVSRFAPRLVARFPAKALMVTGMLPVIAGMAWLSQVSPATSYATGLLGPMLLIGTGMGMVFVPLTTASLAGVAPADSGAAASLVNVMQQVGGSIGLAALVSVYGTATGHAHPVAGSAGLAQLRSHGMAVSFGVAAIFDVCALLVILLTIRSGRPVPAEAAAEAPRLVRVGEDSAG
jgi:predicted MFS family arabinose efflux permease